MTGLPDPDSLSNRVKRSLAVALGKNLPLAAVPVELVREAAEELDFRERQVKNLLGLRVNFLSEVERRAGATRDAMIVYLSSPNLNSLNTIQVLSHWLRRILGSEGER